MGTVTHLSVSDQIVSVLFDDPSIGHVLHIDGVHEPIDIERMDHTFTYCGSRVVRRAFPLMPCWACTIHKVQGNTYKKIVIDIG